MRKFIHDGDYNFRVFLDGVDISHRCYGVDEELGEAYCYDLKDGKFYKTLKGDELAKIVLKGEVKLIDIRKKL